MPATLHLIKLCVGVDTVAELDLWRSERRMEAAVKGQPWRSIHVTHWGPKRAQEILANGSLYWVIKGLIQVRQRIIGFEPVNIGDGITRCAIVMDPELVQTSIAPRRPFQGWRYLNASDAPPDVGRYVPGQNELPAQLRAGLAEMGVL